MESIAQFSLIIVLVLLNGFFVASEFALVSVRKTRIDELVNKGNRTAKLVQRAIKDLDTFISSTQLGITLASLALGWLGEPALADFFAQYMTFLPENMATFSSHSLIIAIAFFIITFLHIVVGEIAPKTIALERAEVISFLIIAPLTMFTIIFKPFIWFLNNSGRLILAALKIPSPSGYQLVHSAEEIKMILTQSAESGAIDKREAELVYNAFKLGDIPVRHVMIPRTDVIAFNVGTTISEVIKRAQRHFHSRFPVYEASIDAIVGFVHIKDIYRVALMTDKDKKLLQTNLIRKIITVPESKRIDEVLLDMRKKRIHIAVVNDEYGGTAGIATLEDIIENLVGEIQDEFDIPEKNIKKQPDGSFLIDGLALVEEVQRRFNFPLKGQGYVTIGGLVFGLLGHEPIQGETVQLGNNIITVEAIEKKRIKTVRLKKDKKK